MSNHEFENYLALVSRLMRLNRAQTNAIRDELRDHLASRVSDWIEAGVDEHEATRKALEEFGDATVLAHNFQTIFQVNQRRWMMRFATFSIAGSFLVAVLVMAMWPSSARFGAPSASVAQDDTVTEPIAIAAATKSASRPRMTRLTSTEDIEKRLQQPFSCDYEETPFVEVMNELRESSGTNIILDMSARDDSLTEDELITFSVRDIRLSTGLRLMLAEHNATYNVHDGILRIISLDVASDPEFHNRKIFDCRALLQLIKETDDRVGTPVSVEVFGGGGNRGGGFGGGGGGVFTVPPANLAVQDQANSEAPTNETSAEQPQAEGAAPQDQKSVYVHRVTAEQILSDVIRTTIDGDSWDDTNGDGTLMMIGGLLVVTQSQRTLDEIESFIAELEKRMR